MLVVVGLKQILTHITLSWTVFLRGMGVGGGVREGPGGGGESRGG